MSSAPTAAEVLDREFWEIRAKILELAACFDRLDRADGSVTQDPRWLNLLQALELVRQTRPDRAEQVLLLFSLPYDEQWREHLGVQKNA